MWLLASEAEEIDCKAYRVVGSGVVAERLQGLLLFLVEPARLEVAEKDFLRSYLAAVQTASEKVSACEETRDSSTAQMEVPDQLGSRNAAKARLMEVAQ